MRLAADPLRPLLEAALEEPALPGAAIARARSALGWERNAGYGTAEHRAGLDRLGVTPHHRRSYAPIVKILSRR